MYGDDCILAVTTYFHVLGLLPGIVTENNGNVKGRKEWGERKGKMTVYINWMKKYGKERFNG